MPALIKREMLEKKVIMSAASGVFALAVAPFIVLNESSGDGMILSILGLLFLPMAYLLSGSLQSSLLEDERKVSAYFWCSTPKGMEGVVAAKYWIVFLFSFCVTALVVVIEKTTAAFGKGSSKLAVIAIILMIIQLFLRSLEMPFVFAFGSKYGNYVKMIVLGMMVLLALAYFLFGRLPDDFSFEHILDFIMKLIYTEGVVKKAKYVIGLLLGLVVLLFYLSYRISCKVYWRGVEEYEN